MGVLHNFAQWLLSVVLYLPRKVVQWLCEGVGALVDGITVPTWWSTASSYMDGIGSDVLWMLSWFNFQAGVPIILGAYLVRFLIRRLPVVG